VKRPEIVPAILLVVAFAIGLTLSPNFGDVRYLLDRTSLYAETGLLVLGMTFIIVTGNIDLSVAANMALSACLFAKLCKAGIPLPAAILIALLIGAIMGAFNGLLVAYAKLPSFLVTLGTMALYRGIAQATVSSASVVVPASFGGLDRLDLPLVRIPMPFGIVLVLAIVLGLVLHRTVAGRWVYSVGINEDAAYFAAVPTRSVKLWVFVMTGILAAGAGLLIDSRLGVARFDHGNGLELDAITAVVLGGTSIYGGRGSILGSVLALLLIAVIRTEMGLLNLSAEIQMTVVGTLLIVAVGLAIAAERFSVRKPAGVKPKPTE